MKDKKIIVVTGISGSGSKEFCKEYAKVANAKVFNMGDLLYQAAQQSSNSPPLASQNLLNLPPHIVELLRAKIFDSILDEIEKNEYSRYVIDMHAQFFWDDIYYNAFDWSYLEKLNADLYITIIEKPSTIKERQQQTEQGKTQDHDLRDLLLWQNIEVNITKGWADNYKKPFYVLPSQQEVTAIESLLDNYFLIYFQMPMTDADGEASRKISAFKEKLLALGKSINNLPTPIVDPRSIDIETGEELGFKILKAIRKQTDHRDLNWYVWEATDLVAIYPKGAPLSKGVSDESSRGYETGKNVFVIYPSKTRSPFMDRATHVFTDEESFFAFYKPYLEKRMQELRRNP